MQHALEDLGFEGLSGQAAAFVRQCRVNQADLVNLVKEHRIRILFGQKSNQMINITYIVIFKFS